MDLEKPKFNILQQYRNLILIFISLASLMIASALFELFQSKEELFELMEEQSHSLLESLLIASRNTLLTNEYLEEISEKRLLNNGNLIKKLYDKGDISDQILREISEENDIFRINIFNNEGQKIYTSHQRVHFDLPQMHSPRDYLNPIFSGQVDTLIIGIKPARFEEGYRYAVALATDDNSAIVLNINAEQILRFKRTIGFGALLRNVAAGNKGIIYAALQDTMNILAASGNVRVLESIPESPLLMSSLRDSLFLTRTIEFDSLQVFEAVHPFSSGNEIIGLLRIGLSMEPIQDINYRIYRRLIIITIILVIIGSIILTFIFTRQRFNLLQKQYEIVETYSSNIINNVSDAIIVFDRDNGIKIFNPAAENIFMTDRTRTLKLSLTELFSESDCEKILSSLSQLQQINCVIRGTYKYLLISKSQFLDRDDIQNTILVIRDLTEQKKIEEQMERKQRLSAMGELASGVAHEIRNPLNTIATIIQQLNKDFEPQNGKEEYHELAQLVSGEVRRINDTVQDFLHFARPDPVKPGEIQVKHLFNQIEKQYQYVLSEKNIVLNINLKWDGIVFWDEQKIKQILINIVQNAIEAMDKKGNILITIKSIDKNMLEIRVSDDGPGMSEEIRSNIFNLYFTTKAKGTGIGLSIVQRIIYEHGGFISVESKLNQGTTFIIQLPIKIPSA
jgi:PAS domain S-box-containing protein